MSFVAEFLEYTEGTTSPELFRKWAALWAVAAALERRVWVTTSSPIYPSLYIILCAPPGVGKTEVIWRAREVIAEIEDIKIAPSSVSRASLIDDLNDATREVVRPNKVPAVYTFNSLQIAINELGVFIPGYDHEFMNTLTDLYDGKGYSEKKRTKKIQIEIPKPQLNLLTGTTPSYLNSMLPEGAWDQGFMSRTFIIYSGERQLQEMFGLFEEKRESHDKLVKSIAKISALFGEMTVADETKKLINNWYLEGGPPTPDHPKLLSYNSRRGVHLVKLCMIAAVDAGSMTIKPEHFHRALDWLIEAEHFMPEVFKAMGAGGAGKNMEEAWHYIFTIYSKEQKPIAEHRLIQFLQERIPVHQIDVTIEMMIKSKLIKKVLQKGGNFYTPGGKSNG